MLLLVRDGLANKQIARRLGIAERTVKAQRSSLMTKLGIHSVAALGQFAEQLRAGGWQRSRRPGDRGK